VTDTSDAMISYLRTLANVTGEEVRKLKENTVARSIQRGESYLAAGMKTDRFACVVSGLFRFYYCDADGKDYTSWFAGEGSFLPSYAMVSLGITSRYTVEALEDSVLAVFPFAVLRELEETSSAARSITRHYLLQTLISYEQREAALVLDDAETRYREFLSDFAPLEKRLKLHHIASYLGMSPVTLSRIRKKMNKN